MKSAPSSFYGDNAGPWLAEILKRGQDLGGPGVVAVSGGADSVALLRLLRALNDSLTVAHLNHQLRGEASNEDERFVAELAGELGVPCRIHRIAIAERAAAMKENLEATAREARYTWLQELAAEHGAVWVATGHTADDQAETVLHRLLRGTGIQGLRGIARRRPLGNGITLVRPLLEVRRGQLVDFLRSINQNWREDSSNRDLAFTRNRIRHELLPLLRTFNPGIEDALGRLAGQAQQIDQQQQELALRLLGEAELPAAGKLQILRRSTLAGREANEIRLMFRQLWMREGWPGGEMTSLHWDRLVAIARGDQTAADFPQGIRARSKASVIQIGPQK